MKTKTLIKSPSENKKVARFRCKEKYIESVFPKQLTESHVRYTPVGDFHFRIGFKKPVQKEGSSMIEYKLVRTYFVKVKMDQKGEWSHEVIDKNHFM